jgi:hypothetical protein
MLDEEEIFQTQAHLLNTLHHSLTVFVISQIFKATASLFNCRRSRSAKKQLDNRLARGLSSDSKGAAERRPGVVATVIVCLTSDAGSHTS